MNRIFGAVALLFAALPATALPARAADVWRNARSAPAASVPFMGYSWSGAYLGLNLGYLSSAAGAFGTRPRGFAGGVQAGYNWQVGQLVFGGEADIQGTAADDTFAAYKFSNPWFGTVRGRVGYAFSNVLVFATGGVVYAVRKLEIAGLSDSRTQVGWTAGGGVEVGLTPGWSAKTEYLFVALPDHTFVLSGIRGGGDSHLLRFGVNYRF
jgi:outer membrane immunogenic protein